MSISSMCLRNTTATTWRFVARLLVTSALVAAPGFALANPSGGQVVAGTAAIAPGGGPTLTINQTSQKAIIDWHSFNIGLGEVTQFNQPSASAITLNRVSGGDPSQILGNLNANGQVWLINPNGILFGKTARVDVAGLLATTIDIANSDFMAGSYHFTSLGIPSAMVVNAGQITIRNAGLASLVAPGVDNSGVIEANLGQIQLSSAAAFTVDLYGDGLFNFALDKQVTQAVTRSDGTKPIAAVSNSGSLIADGGRILLTANVASSVVNNSINMSGYAQATTASQASGVIALDGGSEGTVEVAGTLNASATGTGQTGGKVEVLGNKIVLDKSARIDVSGSAGGGKAIVGGDFGGGWPNPAMATQFDLKTETTLVRNADSVTIAKGAVINASAATNGSGGDVAVWANTNLSIFGSILANGGSKGGNGGFVETSGHGLFDINSAMVSVAAGRGGKWGNWLIDPTFTITAAGDTNTSILIRPGDLIAVYGVGSFLPDDDDGGITDPSEEFEYRFPWSVVPRDGLFAQVGGVGPTPIFPGANFGFGITTGPLVLGMNSEDGGPAGQYVVNVVVVRLGELPFDELAQLTRFLEPPHSPAKQPPPTVFELGYRVDYSFISSHEGGQYLYGYVPQRFGKALGNSGVTIATGVDLGQQTVISLENLGIDQTLIGLLTPYLGKTKQVAIDFLAARPLSITAAQAQELDVAIGRSIVSTVAGYFDTSQTFTKFADLPSEAQTVIADLAYQYGPNLKFRAKSFWTDVTSGNWQAAESELRNFGDAYQQRRTDEARLLQTAIDAGTLPSPKSQALVQ